MSVPVSLSILCSAEELRPHVSVGTAVARSDITPYDTLHVGFERTHRHSSFRPVTQV